MEMAPGRFTWRHLETAINGITPEAVFYTGARKLLAWCMLDTPAAQQDFLADLANEYGTLRGNPLRLAQDQRSLADEAALHEFLLGLVEVRLRHASGSNEQAKAVVSAMLKNTMPLAVISA